MLRHSICHVINSKSGLGDALLLTVLAAECTSRFSMVSEKTGGKHRPHDIDIPSHKCCLGMLYYSQSIHDKGRNPVRSQFVRTQMLSGTLECLSGSCIVAGMRGHPQQAPDVFRPGRTTSRKHTSWGIQGMHRIEACLGIPFKHVFESPYVAQLSGVSVWTACSICVWGTACTLIG